MTEEQTTATFMAKLVECYDWAEISEIVEGGELLPKWREG